MSSVQHIDLRLETSTIRVVHESIIQAFKAHKKYIEKEIAHAMNNLTKVHKQKKGRDAALTGLKQHGKQLQKLKSHYMTLIEIEDRMVQSLQGRVEHLSQVNQKMEEVESDDEDKNKNEITLKKEATMKEFFEKRLNRLILEYLQRSGYVESARLFTQQNTLEDFSDMHVYEEASEIVNQLKQSKNCTKALNWCSANKTKLQKNRSQLEFKLRIQEFLWILHTKSNSIDALNYARSSLIQFAREEDTEMEQKDTVIQVMGLIAYPEHIRKELPVFKLLFGDSPDSIDQKWNELAQEFEKECFAYYGLPKEPQLFQALETGISVLKSAFCNQAPREDEEMKDVDAGEHISECPTCEPKIRSLGQKLPNAHLEQTSITCRVSGQLMNEMNHPLFLPSGYIISEKGRQILISQYQAADNSDLGFNEDLRNLKKSDLKMRLSIKGYTEDQTQALTRQQMIVKIQELPVKGRVIFLCPVTSVKIDNSDVRKVFFS